MSFTLCIIIFFTVLIAILAMWEKRLLWPYGGPEPGPAYPDQGGYAGMHVNQAMQFGFQPLTWTRNLNGDLYRVSYAWLVSPDRECLALIGSGTMASVPFTGTWIYSRDSRGIISFSSDYQGMEIDISGSIKCQYCPGASFAQIVGQHREWLHSRGIMPQPFTPGAGFDEYRTSLIAHRMQMMDKGLIKFTDSTQTRWSYRFLGACKLSISNYGIGMVRAITFGKFPRTA